MCDEAKVIMDKAVANIMRDPNVEDRMRNTIIYGTSHPEILKTAQDEEIEAMRAENARLLKALKGLVDVAQYCDGINTSEQIRAARAAMGESDDC